MTLSRISSRSKDAPPHSVTDSLLILPVALMNLRSGLLLPLGAVVGIEGDPEAGKEAQGSFPLEGDMQEHQDHTMPLDRT
jgi:hypothetical protein